MSEFEYMLDVIGEEFLRICDIADKTCTRYDTDHLRRACFNTHLDHITYNIDRMTKYCCSACHFDNNSNYLNAFLNYLYGISDILYEDIYHNFAYDSKYTKSMTCFMKVTLNEHIRYMLKRKKDWSKSK